MNDNIVAGQCHLLNWYILSFIKDIHFLEKKIRLKENYYNEVCVNWMR